MVIPPQYTPGVRAADEAPLSLKFVKLHPEYDGDGMVANGSGREATPVTGVGLIAFAGAEKPPTICTDLAVIFAAPLTTSAFVELEFTTISPLVFTMSAPLTENELEAVGLRVCMRASSTLTVTEEALVNPAPLVAEHDTVVPAV